MIFQSIMMKIHISPASTTFLGCSIAFIWVLGVENMSAWIWYVQILLIYELHRGKFFLVFFLFLARNGSEFLVSCQKSKSKKNGTHNLDPQLSAFCMRSKWLMHLFWFWYGSNCISFIQGVTCQFNSYLFEVLLMVENTIKFERKCIFCKLVLYLF